MKSCIQLKAAKPDARFLYMQAVEDIARSMVEQAAEAAEAAAKEASMWKERHQQQTNKVAQVEQKVRVFVDGGCKGGCVGASCLLETSTLQPLLLPHVMASANRSQDHWISVVHVVARRHSRWR